MSKGPTRRAVVMDASKYPILDKQVAHLPNQITDESVPITLKHAWTLYSAVHRLGLQAVMTIMAVGAIISHGNPEDIPNIGDESLGLLYDIQTLPEAEKKNFEYTDEVLNYDPSYGKNTSDRLLSFTYGLLRRRLITWNEAADFVSVILARQINPDAWRKRVTRWAEDQGLPRVEQRRRTPLRTEQQENVRTIENNGH